MQCGKVVSWPPTKYRMSVGSWRPLDLLQYKVQSGRVCQCEERVNAEPRPVSGSVQIYQNPLSERERRLCKYRELCKMDRDKIPRAYDLAARREREFRKERAEREARGRPREVEDGFQPSMLTFKAFLQTQDDSITDGEALEKYGEYKLEFQRQQLNEFFVSHKSEEWFRIKYQPEARAARQVELQARLSARLAAFTELLREGGDFCEVTVEEDQAELLVQLLDRTVGMLENSEQPMEGDSDGHRTTSVFIASVHPRYRFKT